MTSEKQNALMELLKQDPAKRKRTGPMSPVRRVMEENVDLFTQLAASGHSQAAVAEAFLQAHGKLNPGDSDEKYRRHIRWAFQSFKAAHGLTASAQGKSNTRKKPERQPRQAAVVKPVAEPITESPPVVKPTNKGFQIPKGKDF